MAIAEEIKRMMDFLPYHYDKETDSNNYNFLKSFAMINADLSDNILELEYAIQIDSASGSYLDDIGLLFRLSRNTDESDSDYRDRIKTYWLNYNRGGLKDNIISAYATFFGLDESKVSIDETTPIIVVVTVDITSILGSSMPSMSDLEDTINDIKAAGVRVTGKLSFVASEDDYEYTDAYVITTVPGTYMIVDDSYQIYSLDVLM